MYKLYFIFLIIGLTSCQNQKKEDILEKAVNNIKSTSPKEEVEKLLPHINVSESKVSNDNGVNECIIELSIGNSVENIDRFFPSYINKELIYCDLAKNPSGLDERFAVEDLKKEVYPKKFGKLLNISLVTTVEERLYTPVNRYCIFINDSLLTITKDEVNNFSGAEKDTIKDFEIVFKKSLSSIINEIKNPVTKSNTNTEKAISENNKKQFNEIQMQLIDGSLKKAKLYLGEPDVFESTFGHITKGFAVYYNIVDNGNTPKHLILFLRWQKGNNNPEIEEIYSVTDNEKACFGIHCIMIKNQTIYTNALDLIYDSGYKKL